MCVHVYMQVVACLHVCMQVYVYMNAHACESRGNVRYLSPGATTLFLKQRLSSTSLELSNSKHHNILHSSTDLELFSHGFYRLNLKGKNFEMHTYFCSII